MKKGHRINWDKMILILTHPDTTSSIHKLKGFVAFYYGLNCTVPSLRGTKDNCKCGSFRFLDFKSWDHGSRSDIITWFFIMGINIFGFCEDPIT